MSVFGLFFNQAGDEGEPGDRFNDVDVGGTGAGDDKTGENSGGMKFAHTS